MCGLASLIALVLISNTITAQALKPTFGGVTWVHEQAQKPAKTPVILIYDDTALGVWPEVQKNGRRIPDPNATAPLVSFPYADIASAIYADSASVDIKQVVAIGALSLFDKTKSYWLTVTAKDGTSALLKLDPDFYQVVLAELEKRAHLTIQKP